MRIVGFVSLFTLILLATQDPRRFIDLPPLLIVWGGAFWGFLAASGPRAIRGWKVTFSKSIVDTEEVQTFIDAYRTSRYGALAGGFFAAGAGIIIMLANLNDPSEIGPGMALGLLGFFYAVVMAYFIFLPLQIGLERRLAAAEGAEIGPAETGLDLLVLSGGFLLTLITFAILITAFSIN